MKGKGEKENKKEKEYKENFLRHKTHSQVAPKSRDIKRTKLKKCCYKAVPLYSYKAFGKKTP